ncbi:unnamed protein product, partial [Prorocentrum cordatum]
SWCKAMRATVKYYVDEANCVRRDDQQQLREQQPIPELDALGRAHRAVNRAALNQYMDQFKKGDPAIANETFCMQVRRSRISFACDCGPMQMRVEASNAGAQHQLLDSSKQLRAGSMTGAPP